MYLITGINGQDGFFTALHLLRGGFKIVGISRRPVITDSPTINLLCGNRNFTHQYLPEYSSAAIDEIVSKSKPSHILHCAGYSSLPKTPEHIAQCFYANRDVLEMLLGAISKHVPSSRLLFLSSAEIFDPRVCGPLTEDSPIDPDNKYGLSKAEGMRVIDHYRKEKGIHCSSAICFNHDSMLSPPERLAKTVVRKLLAYQSGCSDDAVFYNAEVQSDFSHASDFACAFKLILENREPEDFIVASGVSTKLIEYIDMVCELIRFKDRGAIQTRIDAKKRNNSRLANPSKLKDKLGWLPKVNVRKLCQEIIDWERESNALFSKFARDVKRTPNGEHISGVSKKVNHISENDKIIPWAKPAIIGREQEYVYEALNSTQISDGNYVARFENEFAKTVDAEFAVSTSSATSALHLAYLSLQLEHGDEVLVPSLTFAATVAMIVSVGAIPRFIDCDAETLGANADSAKKLITDKTKAIVLTHLFGNSCDMDPFLKMCKEHGLKLVEDAAQAVGVYFGGRHVGCFGDCGCFSFQATKTITMGEGGIFVTNDEKLAKNVRLLRNHGMTPDRHYWHDVIGYNYRLTNLQAAMGCAQLERLEDVICKRERIRRDYADRLKNIRGVRLQTKTGNVKMNLWTQAVILDPRSFPQGRDGVRDKLRQMGVETRPIFYPAHKLRPYICYQGECPVTEEVSQWGLLLPVFEELTEGQVEYICGSLASLSTNT